MAAIVCLTMTGLHSSVYLTLLLPSVHNSMQIFWTFWVEFHVIYGVIIVICGRDLETLGWPPAILRLAISPRQKQKEWNTANASENNAVPSPRINKTCFFGGWHTAFFTDSFKYDHHSEASEWNTLDWCCECTVLIWVDNGTVLPWAHLLFHSVPRLTQT